MKTVGLFTRRPGTSRDAFRDYYENQHSRLGSRYFPFRKYVRNHLLSSSVDVDFDVISEFFFGDSVDIADVHSGRVRKILRADERQFMNQGLNRPASAEEVLLVGPPRGIASAGTRRQMLLLEKAGDDATFRSAVAAWGSELAVRDKLPRTSVDYTAPSAGSRFPYDAMLSLWLPDNAEAVGALQAPEASRLVVNILTEVYESTPKLLQELFQPLQA